MPHCTQLIFSSRTISRQKYHRREINSCSCRKYPSSWGYCRTMDKFLTKTDNVINHTADRMKLSGETFVQGFVKTCGWMIDCWTVPHNFLHNRRFFTAQFAPLILYNFNFFPTPCQMPCLIKIPRWNRKLVLSKKVLSKSLNLVYVQILKMQLSERIILKGFPIFS